MPKTQISRLSDPNTTNLGVIAGEFAYATEQNQRYQANSALQLRVDMETALPQGYATNYTILPVSVSGNLSVALNGLNDILLSDIVLDNTNIGTEVPAVTGNLVYARFSDSIEKINSNLNISLPSGTNWFNLSSDVLDGRTAQLFVYLIRNVSGVRLGLSRLPYFKTYGDASTTNDNDYYMATSDTCATADEVINIGRINVQLNANSWVSVLPEVCNAPKYNTDELECNPLMTASAGTVSGLVGGVQYLIQNNTCLFKARVFGIFSASFKEAFIEIPFTYTDSDQYIHGMFDDADGDDIIAGTCQVESDNARLRIVKFDNSSATAGSKKIYAQGLVTIDS